MPGEWILTHRLGGKRGRDARLAAADQLARHVERLRGDCDVCHDRDHPSSRVRRVVRVRGERDALSAHGSRLSPDVIIEPRVRYRPHMAFKFLGGRRPVLDLEAPARSDARLDVTVLGDGRPLAGAEVALQVRRAGGAPALLEPVESDEAGRAALPYDEGDTPLVVAAYPHAGYWSTVVRGPRGAVTIDCPPLPRTGATAWWHAAMGLDRAADDAGRGVVVGIVGTGVSRHPCLEHVVRLDDADDVSSHGTMVCGLVGARPVRAGQLRGLAPGAEIVTLRVFERENGGISHPDQGDIAQAIDRMVRRDGDGPPADIINMSLGAEHSIGLHDAVVNALQHGTLCVCSAGNSGRDVEYPAALPETLGVGALGHVDWGPADSTAVLWMPDAQAAPERFGRDGLFVPLFSCHGDALACAAPGDGVISTVPPTDAFPEGYAAMDGTSLASPAVAALLATLLAEDDAWRALPRSRARADAALVALRRHCADLGLARTLQGAGLPRRQPLDPSSPILPSREPSRPSPRSGPNPGSSRT